MDDFSPLYQGDTSTPLTSQFPVSLTGMTISMKMQHEGGAVQLCTGPWTVDNTYQAHYQWQSADVAVPGIWKLFVTLTDGNGRPAHPDPKILEILAVP